MTTDQTMTQGERDAARRGLRFAYKAIGGPCAGRDIMCDDEKIVLHEWPARKPTLAESVQMLERGGSEAQSVVPHTYTRRRMHFPDGALICYYAPEAMSDFDAIATVLT